MLFEISSESYDKLRIWLLGGLKPPREGHGTRFKKKLRNFHGGANPNPKFQYSSSIRKCLKIGGNFGGLKHPEEGRWTWFQNFEKTKCRTVRPVFVQPAFVQLFSSNPTRLGFGYVRLGLDEMDWTKTGWTKMNWTKSRSTCRTLVRPLAELMN